MILLSEWITRRFDRARLVSFVIFRKGLSCNQMLVFIGKLIFLRAFTRLCICWILLYILIANTRCWLSRVSISHVKRTTLEILSEVTALPLLYFWKQWLLTMAIGVKGTGQRSFVHQTIHFMFNWKSLDPVMVFSSNERSILVQRMTRTCNDPQGI